MKCKCIGAAVLAAAIVLSGCAESKESAEIALEARSTRDTSALTSSVAPVQSTSAAVSFPEVSSDAASSFDTQPECSMPEMPQEVTSSVISDDTSVTEIPQLLEREIVGMNETRTVSSGETLDVESGKMLQVIGTLIIESGATLNVASGAELLIEGSVQLGGDIVLSEGGKLSMGSDTAMIDGSGSVIVKDDFEQIDCERGTIKAHIIPPERVVTNGVTRVGGVVIANKAIKLPPEFGSHLSLNEVEPEVYAALEEMSADAGHWYVNRSGYRSYWDQQSAFQSNVDLFGFERADMLSSRAGHSEHQTGLTMDLDSFDQNYGTTPDGKWLADNCWRYGFIIRYPKGKEHITGYDYEPWHVRYLGKSTAKLVFDSGLTLEEFLNVEGGTVVIDD